MSMMAGYWLKYHVNTCLQTRVVDALRRLANFDADVANALDASGNFITTDQRAYTSG